MTGYGRAEGSVGSRRVTIEVRSVNGKGLDLSLRTPSVFRSAEQLLRTLAAGRIVRGKSELSLQYASDGVGGSTTINLEAFRSAYRELSHAARQVGLPLDGEPLVATILRMPEVLAVPETVGLTPEELTALETLTTEALDQFAAFRATEGAALMRDLLGRIETIRRLLTQIEPYEAERIETVRTRLNENLQKSQATIDPVRFEAEIIYYLEKFDVTEEKVRLAQHLDYFCSVAADGGDAGRKLGFIAQEMGREINTLGSKANHHAMQRLVVEMKDELEKIKEQVLNIL